MAKMLVTGARRGIGLVTAIELARRGHHVYASVRRPEQFDELTAAASDAGVTLEPVVLDVSDPDSIASAAAVILADGAIDVVVNNAGVNQVGPIEYTDAEVMNRTFATNVVGPMLLAQAFIPSMRAQGSGLFVTISSVARYTRFTPPSFSAVYAASKAAASCFAESLNKEVAGFGLRSIAVELSAFETDMTEAGHFDPSIVGPDSPYATVATVQAESLAHSPPPPATDAALFIADLVEEADPPLRSICPPELDEVIGRSAAFGDADYIAQCTAASGRDWARAFRSALNGS